ncbi:MAG: DsrE family protein [Chitinophagaceae bacterium]|nr:DsrE family protein [Chitinophagaceae bacterium]MDP1763874.1 DsrE family protein [Sediminibacterium sp.]MDP1811622.1 DsrE family protein [Sediminibacterium sp.]MDP3127380.1 DsrE family protein [Sediminibacterium sp.]MDP3665444.1 DsrE family protein [Sediminibacterium sp.]
MKKLLVAVLLLTAGFSVNAQNEKYVCPEEQMSKAQKPFHKIIFQITTEDSLAQKALVKQLNNILTLAPDAKLEVVCHGPGLSMLVTAKTIVQDKIAQMKKKGVEFVACEFSMSERNVTKDKIIPEAGFVKGGIIEIVTKQEEGWSYIKSGF